MWAYLLLQLKNPLIRKIIIFVGVGLVIFFVFKWWIRKHDDRIYQEGKQAASIELEKAKKAEWQKINADLKIQKEELAAGVQELELNQRVLAVKIAEDAKHRQREDMLYNQIIGWSKVAKEQINAEVTNIPAGELVNSIRLQSAKLPSTIRR